MVLQARLELAHPRGYLGLSQARLPFRHSSIAHFSKPYPFAKAASPFLILSMELSVLPLRKGLQYK